VGGGTVARATRPGQLGTARAGDAGSTSRAGPDRPGHPHPVDIATGDLTDSATIDAACTGVTTVVSTATGMGSRRRGDSLRAIDRAGQLALVTAAKRCGVQRFVYMSISPNFGPVAPLLRYKREVERAVVASGMRYTILQPSAFMEVWLGPLLKWDLKAGTGQIFGKGDRPMSLISIDDVAAFSVIGATDPRAANRVIPLGGPQAITPVEVVRIFESVTGKDYACAGSDPADCADRRRALLRAGRVGRGARSAGRRG